jgi:hypothetical protein
MLQKTAFLLALWGHRNCSDWGGKLDPLHKASILLNAHHKDVPSTMTYPPDSGTLKQMLDQVYPHSVHQCVGQYGPIFVKTLNNFAALNQAEGNPSHRLNNKTLPELAVLVDPLKSWAYHAGKVVECVSKCHGGNLGMFLDETTGFLIVKWACCHGIKHKACFDRSKF